MSFSLPTSVANQTNLQNLTQTTLPDMRVNYKVIAEDLCKNYYNLYDNNFGQLSSLYTLETIFSFLDEELVGFTNFSERIRQYNIYKFTHHTVNVNSQPVGSYALLLTVTGKVSVNNSIYQQNYVETLLLQMDEYGRMFITNNTFKLFE